MSLESLLMIFRRRWRIFFVIMMATAIVATLSTFALTKLFTSTAEIKLDPTTHRELDASRPADTAVPDQAMVDTEVSIMRNRSIAEAVVDRLGLQNNPEFSKPSVGFFSGLIGGPPKTDTAEDHRQAAIGNVQKRVIIQRQGGTYVVSVSAASRNPATAAAIANAYADAYLVHSLTSQVGDATRQTTWLNQRLEKLGANAEAADAALARYKATNGITTSGLNGQTVTDQQIAQITSQLATAESDAAAARSALSAARTQAKTIGPESVSSVINSSVIADLRRQRAEVLRAAAEAETRYGPKHPETTKIHEQLTSLNDQIQAEAQRILDSLQNAAASTEARADALRHMLAQLQGAQSSNGRASVEADALQRKADATRLMYTQLAQTAQRTSQERESQATPGRVVEPALPAATPSFPNRRLFALLGLVIGGVAGIATILILEALDSSVRTIGDVQDTLGVELIASIPRITRRQLDGMASVQPADFVIEKPMSRFAEGVRTVRSSLLLTRGADGRSRGSVIAVTSALANEGKTTCAVTLARIMGMSGEKILLIECDLRRRALQEIFPKTNKSGLLEVLSGKSSLSQAVQADTLSQVDVLIESDPAFKLLDILGSAEMRRLLAEARERYDYIILDTPPILAVADARTVSALADSVLLIVRWGRTSRQAAQAALARLQGDGVRAVGVVLTMVDMFSSVSIDPLNPSYYHKELAAYCED